MSVAVIDLFLFTKIFFLNEILKKYCNHLCYVLYAPKCNLFVMFSWNNRNDCDTI